MNGGRATERGRDFLAVAILLIASAALFAPWFAGDHVFLGISPAAAPPWPPAAHDPARSDFSSSDALALTWPNLVHWTDSVRRHDWRGLLWNPRTLCGSPFLGGQIAFPLYPTNLLALFGGAAAFFLWTPLLHVALANAGAYFALRRLALSRPACLLGAWTFGAGSWFLAHLAIVNFVQAGAWLPWIALAADRALVEGRPRDRLLLAACVALSILAGMIQITAISLVGAAILVRARAEEVARREGPRAARRGLASAALGVVLGLMLAGPQLLPLVEWSRQSARMQAPASEARRLAYLPAEWAHLAIPEILGSPAAISYWTRPGSGDSGGPALEPPVEEATYPPAAFAGVRGRGESFVESVCSPLAAGLVLVLCALGRPRRATWVFLALVAAGALLSMDTPLLRALTSLPGGAAANPRRMLLLCAAGFPALVALGVDRIRTDARIRPLAWLPAIVVFAWWGLNVAAPDDVSRTLSPVEAGLGHRMPWIFKGQAVQPFAAFFVAAIAAGGGRAGRWRLAALGLVAFGDSLAFQLRNHPVRPSEPLFPPTELTRMLESSAAAKTEPAPGIPVACEDDALPPVRMTRFRSALPGVPAPIPPNVAMLFRVRDLQGYGGILPRRLEEVVEAIEPGIVFDHEGIGAWSRAESFASPCVRFMAVRHVLAADHEIPNTYTVRQFPAETASLFGIAGAQPRVTALASARVFDDDAALLRAFTSGDFDPSRALLLARDAAAIGLEAGPGRADIDLPAPEAGESVTWTQHGAAEADVTASLRAPRILVVAESFHPGWHAFNEAGGAVRIIRANHAFQALLLPQGGSRLRVVFQPASLSLGFCALAFGVLAACADMILRRRRAAQAA